MKVHVDPDSDELNVETPMRMQAHGQISATALGQQYIVLGLKSGVVQLFNVSKVLLGSATPVKEFR